MNFPFPVFWKNLTYCSISKDLISAYYLSFEKLLYVWMNLCCFYKLVDVMRNTLICEWFLSIYHPISPRDFPLWFPQPIRLFCNLFPYPQILLNILQLFLIQVLSRLSYISALGMMTRVTSQVRLLPIQKILLTLMIMTVIINCLCTGCFY